MAIHFWVNFIFYSIAVLGSEIKKCYLEKMKINGMKIRFVFALVLLPYAIEVSASPPPPSVPHEAIQMPISELLVSESPEPVKMPFDYSVDRRGMLMMDFPIDLPKGVNGLAPEISVSFQQPTGYADNTPAQEQGKVMRSYMGSGWSIGGISTITDNFRDDVRFQGFSLYNPEAQGYAAQSNIGNDQLLRLRGADSGTSSNLDFFEKTSLLNAPSPFSRFRRFGAGLATSFEMYKGGYTYEFGSSEHGRSAIVLPGNFHNQTWFLQKVEDSFGNTISYRYNKSEENIYPSRIVYSGNEIRFIYGSRPEHDSGYVVDAVLRQVQIYSNDILVSEINLDYTTGSSRGLSLSALQQCGYSSTDDQKKCTQPIAITHLSPTKKDIDTGLDHLLSFTFESAYSRFEREVATQVSEFGDSPFEVSTIVSDYNAGWNLGFGDCADISTCARGMTVIAVEESNGVGGVNRTEYSYANVPARNEAVKIKNPDGTYTYTLYEGRRIPTIFEAVQGHVLWATWGSPNWVGRTTRIERHTQEFNNSQAGTLMSRSDYEWELSCFGWYARNKAIDHIVSNNGVSVGAKAVQYETSCDNAGVLASTHVIEDTGFGMISQGELSGLEKRTQTTSNFENDIDDVRVGFLKSKSTNSDVPHQVAETTLIYEFERFKSDSFKVGKFKALSGSDKELVTDISLDPKGNPVSISVSGSDVETRTELFQNYLYDIFPQKIINAAGHETYVEAYDQRFGEKERIRDRNDQISTTLRDVFENVTTQIKPNGTVIISTYQLCSDGCQSIEGVDPSYKVVTTTSHPMEINKGAPDVVRFYDQLGRVIRVETEGFEPGTYSKLDTLYDSLGRVAKKSEPYQTGTPQFTQYSYDLFGRVTKIESPNGGEVESVYEQLLDRYTVMTSSTIVNNIGGTEVSIEIDEFNSLGQRIRSIDAVGTEYEVLTEFQYDHLGNNNWIRVDENDYTTIEMEFDIAGNMIVLDDPSAGRFEYDYDVLGQMLLKTDARGISTKYSYDLLGRLVEKIGDYNGEQPVVSGWEYDTRKQGLMTRRFSVGFNEDYFYDSSLNLARVESGVEIGDEQRAFILENVYDYYGRKKTQTFPSGFKVFSSYSEQGYSEAVSKNDEYGQILSQINSTNAYGRVTKTTLGNGLVTERFYEPSSGQLTGISTGNGDIQDYNYSWWSNGALLERRRKLDDQKFQVELFNYDSLNRLRSAITTTPANTRTLNYSYDVLGNLLSKTDSSGSYNVSGYEYSSEEKPYLLSEVTVNGMSRSLSYDLGGNVTQYDSTGTEKDRAITYNAYGKPSSIVVGDPDRPTAMNSFQYGPSGKRFLKNTKNNRIGIVMLGGITIIWPRHVVDKTIYLYDGVFEVVIPAEGADTIEKTRLGDVIHIREVSGSNVEEKIEYLHTDNLGSIDVVTNHAGEVVSTSFFDPFGTRRSEDWGSGSSSPSIDFHHQHTSRGFTGHEQLDDTGFIHMGGRVYDPLLGRFISPDPWIQDSTNSQNFNRYSYVWNNPVQYTDPSGELIWFAYIAYAAAVYGAGEFGWNVGTAGYEIYSGEKAVTDIAKDFAIEASTDALVTATFGAAGKVLEKVVPDSAQDAIKNKASEIFSNITSNKNSSSGAGGGALPREVEAMEAMEGGSVSSNVAKSVDPGKLKLPPERADGADPMKLSKQMKEHGTSTNGMLPVQVTKGKDGVMMINDGVTRSTRIDTFNKIDGTNQKVPIEIIENNPSWNFSDLPSIED